MFVLLIYILLTYALLLKHLCLICLTWVVYNIFNNYFFFYFVGSLWNILLKVIIKENIRYLFFNYSTYGQITTIQRSANTCMEPEQKYKKSQFGTRQNFKICCIHVMECSLTAITSQLETMKLSRVTKVKINDLFGLIVIELQIEDALGN